MKDVIIALAGTAFLAFLFDITSRGREDTVSRVFNFASYYFHGGGR